MYAAACGILKCSKLSRVMAWILICERTTTTMTSSSTNPSPAFGPVLCVARSSKRQRSHCSYFTKLPLVRTPPHLVSPLNIIVSNIERIQVTLKRTGTQAPQTPQLLCLYCECLSHYFLCLILLLLVFSTNKLHPASMHGLFVRLLIS